MRTRLTVLVATSLFLLLMSALFATNESYHTFNIPLFFFFISLVIILYYVLSDAEFNLTGHVLVVNRPFHKTQSKYDLKLLRQWEETDYYIRGHHRRNLILAFDQGRTVELSNREHKDRYEAVLKYLKNEFPLIEKFNLTPLQEIKFEALHDLLTSDFYTSGKNDSQGNMEKNRRLSIEVFRMKMEGAGRDQIAEVLLKIKIKGMGENETISRCLQIADQLLGM